jgi:hypothetical protein
MDAAAMLAKAMGTDKHRTASFVMTPGLTAHQSVFERLSVPTSFKSVAVNLPAICMFVVLLTD